ncbi:MAG: PTS system mannose/fructose/sorbose family transporter subunit IID [Candidatus Firestonebacteria bacterium]
MYKLIKKIDLLKVLIRSFFIETSWNFEGMQNIGFAYALLPVVSKICKTKEEKVKFIKRHIKFLNTHPSMALFIMGVVINLEEKNKLKENANEANEIEDIKNSMMGPLAAIGDNVFWEYLRPFSALLGVSIVLLSKNNLKLALLGPLVSLLIYNLFNIFIRYIGIVKGYEQGISVVNYLHSLNLQRICEKLSLFASFVLGVTLATSFQWQKTSIFNYPIFNNLLFLITTFLLVGALKIRISSTVTFYCLVIICIIFKYFIR